MNNPYFDLVKAVWKNAKSWRGSVVACYLAYVTAQASLSLTPYAFGRTVNVLQHFNPSRLHEVIFWIGISIAFLAGFWLFHGPARIKECQVALNAQQYLRHKIYSELTSLPLKWHQDHHSGNIVTRINRAASSLFRFASEQFIYIEAIIKVLVSCGFLIWLSPPLGLLNLLCCIVALTIVVKFDQKIVPLYRKQNEVDNHIGATLFDYISNMTTILTLRLNKLTTNNLVRRMLTIWPIYRKSATLNECKWFGVGMILTTLQSVIIIGYIIHSLSTTNSILIGSIVMIFRYQWDLNDVFFNFTSQYSELVRMDSDVKGLDPIIQDIKRFSTKSKTMAHNNTEWKKIDIEKLIFCHDLNREKHHLTLNKPIRIQRGEKIALIGSSGGGKSTLLNLMRGLYEAEQVSLIIDETPYTSLKALRSITTLIPQDPEIFENTIRFNITLDLPATDEEIHTAVKLAHFDEVLAMLPVGLNTDIREKGLNLSVGQKQRLALARGLFAARYSSLILMDEPTSSVDLPTEEEILTKILAKFARASIIISLHRLHLLPKFDRIIMLSEGEILANGLTKQLLVTPGPVQEVLLKYQQSQACETILD